METNIKLDLPAVPEFVIPQANGDGSHPVAEMRLNGKSFLDQEVRIKGTVLWIYDCATVIRTPEMSDKDLQEVLATQPERCLRPHFIHGEDASAKTERGIQVVEYPRPLRKDEKTALGDELVAEMEAALAAFFPGQSGKLKAMAEEAAMSRLYGGIHFRSDNDAGLALGRAVAARALARPHVTAHW